VWWGVKVVLVYRGEEERKCRQVLDCCRVLNCCQSRLLENLPTVASCNDGMLVKTLSLGTDEWPS
jgi:hypothetical protein